MAVHLFIMVRLVDGNRRYGGFSHLPRRARDAVKRFFYRGRVDGDIFSDG